MSIFGYIAAQIIDGDMPSPVSRTVYPTQEAALAYARSAAKPGQPWGVYKVIQTHHIVASVACDEI